MKRVDELKPGDVIRFPYGSHTNIVRVVVINTEPYTTWTRLTLQEYGGTSRFNTWLNTDALVEVVE